MKILFIHRMPRFLRAMSTLRIKKKIIIVHCSQENDSKEIERKNERTMMSNEADAPLPIEDMTASASLSMSDVNIMVADASVNRMENATPTLAENNSSAAGGNFKSFDGIGVDDSALGDGNISKKGNGSSRLRSIMVATVVVSLVLALGLGLGLGLQNNNRGETLSKSTSQQRPSQQRPSQQRPSQQESPSKARPTLEEVVTYLSNGVSDESALRRSGSPQNKAARWLATEDGAAISLPKQGFERRRELHQHTGDSDAYMYVFRYVMAVSYFALNGPNWTFDHNFMNDGPVCSWNDFSIGISGEDVVSELGGVLCDEETHLPIALDLELNDLQGEIPTELGLLGSLKMLDFESNEIQGKIPTEMCELRDLEFLQLKMNNLAGELPSCLSQLDKMKLLTLNNNALSGSFPPGICSLSDLEVLILDSNIFSGALPRCIRKLEKLKLISMSDNGFEGGLPNLSTMSNLTQVFADGNSLTGDPIPSLSGLANLKLLYLEDNQFSADIHRFAWDMPDLGHLDLSHNKFTCDSCPNGIGIPRHLFELEKLVILDLSNNLFEGDFPAVIPVQENMVFFSVHENKMTGPLPSGLKNLTAMIHLDLANNNFDGTMPDEFFEMPSLKHIFLSENPNLVAGPIPSGLKDMTGLTEISLKNTNRNGPLPELLNFTKLFLLDLDNNDFDGTIPLNYEKLTRLRYMILNNNPSLDGTLPSLSQLKNMNTILLDGTGVTGDFSSVCNLPAFTGEQEFPTVNVALADCKDDDSGIDCDCCHCCSKTDAKCSDGDVASFDWNWEKGFWRDERDFQLDFTLMDPPKNTIEENLPQN